jgi:hypothetical protein
MRRKGAQQQDEQQQICGRTCGSGINDVDASASMEHVFLSMETEPCASAGLLR